MSAHTTPSDPGRFRHRATIRRQASTTRDEWGVIGRDEAPALARWCEIEPLSARERTADAATTHDVSHRVRMRWTPDLRPGDSIEFRGRTLHVQSLVNVGEDDVELVALCTERNSG